MRGPDTPVLSVVVPYRDARASLPSLLAALAAQTLGKAAFEVVLVDDRSRDGGLAGLSLPLGLDVVALSSARAGPYAARNQALREARGSAAVAFTDADCVPAPDWLERGLAALERSPRVAGRVDVVVSEANGFTERLDRSRFLRQEHYATREGFGATANLFWRRSVLDDVGDFDERLLSGADEEHGRRALSLGGAIAYADDVVVAHPARRRFIDLAFKAARVGYGVGQKTRLYGLDDRALLARARDRLTLGRRGPENQALHALPARALFVGGHALLALCTAAGAVGGLAAATTSTGKPAKVSRP